MDSQTYAQSNIHILFFRHACCGINHSLQGLDLEGVATANTVRLNRGY